MIAYDREEFNEQTAEARAKLRYDLSSATSLEADVGYARFLEGFSDPDTPAAAAERPGVDEFDATLGVEQHDRPLEHARHRLRRSRDPRGGAARGRRRRRPERARQHRVRRAPPRRLRDERQSSGRSPRWRSGGATSTMRTTTAALSAPASGASFAAASSSTAATRFRARCRSAIAARISRTTARGPERLPRQRRDPLVAAPADGSAARSLHRRRRRRARPSRPRPSSMPAR